MTRGTSDLKREYLDLLVMLFKDARRVANGEPSVFQTDRDRKDTEKLARDMRRELNRRGEL